VEKYICLTEGVGSVAEALAKKNPESPAVMEKKEKEKAATSKRKLAVDVVCIPFLTRDFDMSEIRFLGRKENKPKESKQPTHN